VVKIVSSLSDPQTKKRETAALIEAMTELKIGRSFIITRDEEENIQTESGLIEVVPVWKWLLES